MKNWTSNPDNTKHMDVAFKAERSIEDELERETSGDILTIAVSYLIMFFYITFSLGQVSTPSRFLVRWQFCLPGRRIKQHFVFAVSDREQGYPGHWRRAHRAAFRRRQRRDLRLRRSSGDPDHLRDHPLPRPGRRRGQHLHPGADLPEGPAGQDGDASRTRRPDRGRGGAIHALVLPQREHLLLPGGAVRHARSQGIRLVCRYKTEESVNFQDVY